jgi:hypothetical protein
VVDKAQKEVVYGTIPITSELVPRGTVPPICIEPTIGKKGEFRKNIELSCAVSPEGWAFIKEMRKHIGKPRLRREVPGIGWTAR